MRVITLGLLLLWISSCGIKITSDPIRVEPIQVIISAPGLVEYFTNYCEERLTDQAEIDQCVKDQLSFFWSAIDAASE